jgi:hypothetical protein
VATIAQLRRPSSSSESEDRSETLAASPVSRFLCDALHRSPRTGGPKHSRSEQRTATFDGGRCAFRGRRPQPRPMDPRPRRSTRTRAGSGTIGAAVAVPSERDSTQRTPKPRASHRPVDAVERADLRTRRSGSVRVRVSWSVTRPVALPAGACPEAAAFDTCGQDRRVGTTGAGAQGRQSRVLCRRNKPKKKKEQNGAALEVTGVTVTGDRDGATTLRFRFLRSIQAKQTTMFSLFGGRPCYNADAFWRGNDPFRVADEAAFYARRFPWSALADAAACFGAVPPDAAAPPALPDPAHHDDWRGATRSRGGGGSTVRSTCASRRTSCIPTGRSAAGSSSTAPPPASWRPSTGGTRSRPPGRAPSGARRPRSGPRRPEGHIFLFGRPSVTQGCDRPRRGTRRHPDPSARRPWPTGLRGALTSTPGRRRRGARSIRGRRGTGGATAGARRGTTR